MKKSIIAILLAMLTMSTFSVALADDISYTVRRGDCLSKIASEYGVSVDAIVKANDIKNRNMISIGQVLRISNGTETMSKNAESQKSDSKETRVNDSRANDYSRYFNEKEIESIDEKNYFSCQDKKVIRNNDKAGFLYNTKEEQHDSIEIAKSMIGGVTYSRTHRMTTYKARREDTVVVMQKQDCSSNAWNYAMSIGATIKGTSRTRNATSVLLNKSSIKMNSSALKKYFNHTNSDYCARASTILVIKNTHAYSFVGIIDDKPIFMHSSSENRATKKWKKHSGRLNLASNNNSIELVHIEVVISDMKSRGAGEIYITVPEFNELDYYVALNQVKEEENDIDIYFAANLSIKQIISGRSVEIPCRDIIAEFYQNNTTTNVSDTPIEPNNEVVGSPITTDETSGFYKIDPSEFKNENVTVTYKTEDYKIAHS